MDKVNHAIHIRHNSLQSVYLLCLQVWECAAPLPHSQLGGFDLEQLLRLVVLPEAAGVNQLL